jgi:rSAM/selenodomain-associated transferase 2
MEMNKLASPFSVIIPTLNEEKIIEKCISNIRLIDENVELIVADGNSTDATTQIAEKCGVKVCSSKPSRGIQCNAGANLATGKILIFLHADTELPAIAFDQLNMHFQNSKTQIGTFRLSFDNDHWLFRLYCIPSNFESVLTRFGDQGIVVRKSFFNFIGGFPDWPLFEDLGLIQKAGKITRIYRFRATVKTSARRFLKNGIFRQQLLNLWYIFLYFIGVSPEKLALLYEKHHEA